MYLGQELCAHSQIKQLCLGPREVHRDSCGGSGLRAILVSWVDQRRPQGGEKLELYLGEGEESESREKEGGHFVEEFNIDPLVHIALQSLQSMFTCVVSFHPHWAVGSQRYCLV